MKPISRDTYALGDNWEIAWIEHHPETGTWTITTGEETETIPPGHIQELITWLTERTSPQHP